MDYRSSDSRHQGAVSVAPSRANGLKGYCCALLTIMILKLLEVAILPVDAVVSEARKYGVLGIAQGELFWGWVLSGESWDWSLREGGLVLRWDVVKLGKEVGSVHVGRYWGEKE